MSKENLHDEHIVHGFRTFDKSITQKYFYGYCRQAYAVFDHKYQLSHKVGLDFYSLAHEYYIQLLTHNFKQLEDRPKDMKLSTWMMGGFRFVVLDALKSYNKEFDTISETVSEDVLEYVRSTDHEEDMLLHVEKEVVSHYPHDRIMQEIAHMLFFAGFKQNEVADQLGITPAAVNQRYKKMMEEVITPFVVEYYAKGIYWGNEIGAIADNEVESLPTIPCSPSQSIKFSLSQSKTPKKMPITRITPDHITSLQDNEIFVFGSNLKGIHAGGAARTAHMRFGAEWGKGEGLQGQSYAIPTMQGGVETIKPYVDKFIAFASQHTEFRFLVTPIGCGIAGFTPEDIAPLFLAAKKMKNIILPQSFWDVIDDM